MSLRRRGIVALALLSCLGLPPPAAAASRPAVGPGFSVAFDDAVWVERPAAAPVVLLLACIAPGCGDAAVSFVADPRPLLRPGAGAFTPGAVAAASVDLRAQSLTPGGRLRAEAPVLPAPSGQASGYCGRYTIEDTALAQRDLVACLARLKNTTLHLRLTGTRLQPEQIEAFGVLRSTLRTDGTSRLP